MQPAQEPRSPIPSAPHLLRAPSLSSLCPRTDSCPLSSPSPRSSPNPQTPHPLRLSSSPQRTTPPRSSRRLTPRGKGFGTPSEVGAMGLVSYPVPQSTTQGGSEPAMLGHEALDPHLSQSATDCLVPRRWPRAPLLPRSRREPRGAASE